MNLPETKLKTTISCRIDPQVKKQIIEEAKLSYMTASNYVENILKRRENEHVFEREMADDVKINELETELALLQHEVEENQELVDSLTEMKKDGDEQNRKLYQKEQEVIALKKENHKLWESIEIFENYFPVENKRLEKKLKESISFDGADLEQVNLCLEKLGGFYPQRNIQELTLASLATAVKNEKSMLFIHTLKSQLK